MNTLSRGFFPIGLSFIAGLFVFFGNFMALTSEHRVRFDRPVKVMFVFDDEGLRDDLSRIDSSGFFSPEIIDRFSNADMIVYKVDGWSKLEQLPGAKSIWPILEEMAAIDPSAVTSMSIANLRDGRKIAFYLSIPSTES